MARNLGKISAHPHTTLCIQFLDRENNDKNNRLPSGKQICFAIVCGLCGNFTVSILIKVDMADSTSHESSSISGLIIRILRPLWKVNILKGFMNLFVKSGPDNLNR